MLKKNNIIIVQTFEDLFRILYIYYYTSITIIIYCILLNKLLNILPHRKRFHTWIVFIRNVIKSLWYIIFTRCSEPQLLPLPNIIILYRFHNHSTTTIEVYASDRWSNSNGDDDSCSWHLGASQQLPAARDKDVWSTQKGVDEYYHFYIRSRQLV